MKRGQAFDTMMLVISVIVAVAILGLLLSFLGGIGGFGAKAKDVIPDLVKKVQSKGFGLEIKENVEFNNGDSIYRKDAVGQAPIDPNDVEFKCPSDAKGCGPINDADAAVQVSDTRIVGRQKISLTVAACLKESDGTYQVVIGKLSDKVRSAAETACNLS